ncbi:hypothetical protein CAPTEDRAFT_202353 [Capitella teleta]|uniref:Uncharacterized protein n=1 Tax=Capitella teleta TaxID=283909 RepID=R7U1S4_CAPTE|nr:hypothetical protein CAPTEDRAFT_202353 [Capitella teleta]|eukprot:ELT97621.1 hypothetical protein CAPTEDRAFT_202353 [Capitella teleta]
MNQKYCIVITATYVLNQFMLLTFHTNSTEQFFKPDDGKKKGKKKEPEVAMTSMPAEYVVLAKFHLPLADLLDGETKVEAILTKSASEIGGRESPQISETESKKMEKKEKKKAGDKGKGQDKGKK